MARVSTWRIELGPAVAREFPTSMIDELLDSLLPHAPAIRTAVAELGVRSAVTFAARYGDVVPKLALSHERIAGIAELACWLDFSIMVVRETEDALEF